MSYAAALNARMATVGAMSCVSMNPKPPGSESRRFPAAAFLVLAVKLVLVEIVGAAISDDVTALLAFKSGVDDPGSVLASWNGSDPDPDPCDWTGVVCGPGGGGVAQLSLAGLSLSGTIGRTLAKLGQLERLDLSRNNFTGVFSGEIAAMPSLTVVNASHNSFSGTMPPEFGGAGNLHALDFAENALSGTLLPQIFSYNCQSLRYVSVAGNHIQGSIPASIGSCLQMEGLNFSSNSFSGEVPDGIWALGKLQTLDLSFNYLSGAIPKGVGVLSNLKSLFLQSNAFSGPVPPELGSSGLLEVLVLGTNAFSGELPVQLGNLRSLSVLEVGRNLVSGGIPSWLVNLTALSKLNLSRNAFHGPIPIMLGSLDQVEVIDLSHNNLTGIIPGNLGDATRVRTLRLQENRLNGSLPVKLGNSTSLLDLNLSRNNFSGQIPSELGRLANLEYLDLSWNSLVGHIPAVLGGLQNLLHINLSHNLLQGPVPQTGIFNHSNSSAFSQNPGLCGQVINVSCSTGSDPYVGSPNSTPGYRSPVSQNKHCDTLLSVSAIAAISAAAVIALGVVAVSLLNVYSQTRWRSDMFTVESDSQSPSGAELAVGRFVMFAQQKIDPKSDARITSSQAILRKDCEIGRGGFGTVFKAMLAHGETVAVKKLMVTGLVKTQQDFENVVHVLRNVKHPNLVGFKGYYWTEQVQLLVYDYLPNGNLYTHLHERRENLPPLNWRTRFKIALGVARGLFHLHHGCTPPLIHYDVKSSNVLLDEDYVPRLSDYSLAKLLSRLDTYVMSSKMQSALGYMAPEFASESLKITEKCDVYGFGVLVLELVTGRRPVEYMEDDVVTLCDTVRALVDAGQALTCVDSKLSGLTEDEVLPVIKLGLICTSQIPSNRPSMVEVVQILELIRPLVESHTC